MDVEGVIFEVEKFATHDGPGIRTVVFLKGCPLRCRWCHSPESWKYGVEAYPNGEAIGRRTTAASVVADVLKDKDFYDASNGGVTLSGGEPLAQAAFCTEILRLAKQHKLHTAIETSGFATEKVIDAVLPYVDTWLYDVKELDPKKYLEYTTRSLAPSLANLRRIDADIASGASKREIVLRLPMIPGLNDDDAELGAIGKLADELTSVTSVDVEPYIPYGIDKARRLGLSVYEASSPPPDYGPAIAAKLSKLTRKKVRLP